MNINDAARNLITLRKVAMLHEIGMEKTETYHENGSFLKAFVVLISSLALFFPVEVATAGGFPLSLADFLPILAVPFFALYFSVSIQSVLFLLSVVVMFLICFSGNIEGIWSGRDVRPIVSMLFFCKNGLVFFLGMYIARNCPKLFIRASVLIAFFFAVVFLMDVALGYEFRVRTGSYINGKALGMNVYGSYGVNSFSVHAALVAMFLFLVANSLDGMDRRLSYWGCFLYSLITVMSFSREAILALLIFFVGVVVTNKKVSFKGLVCFFTAVLIFWLLYDYGAFAGLFESKLNQINGALKSGSLNDLSSGRVDLVWAALIDIYNNPLWGTVFNGYEFEGGGRLQGKYETLQGLSPHNYFVTLFWKSGILAGLIYLFFIISCLSPALKFHNKGYILSFFAAVVSMMMLWDVLMISTFGSLFFIAMPIVGVFSWRGN